MHTAQNLHQSFIQARKLKGGISKFAKDIPDRWEDLTQAQIDLFKQMAVEINKIIAH